MVIILSLKCLGQCLVQSRHREPTLVKCICVEIITRGNNHSWLCVYEPPCFCDSRCPTTPKSLSNLFGPLTSKLLLTSVTCKKIHPKTQVCWHLTYDGKFLERQSLNQHLNRIKNIITYACTEGVHVWEGREGNNGFIFVVNGLTILISYVFLQDVMPRSQGKDMAVEEISLTF